MEYYNLDSEEFKALCNEHSEDYEDLAIELEDGDVIILAEGTGDNLLEEDQEEGYVDYFMTYDAINNSNGYDGQWLTDFVIRDRFNSLTEAVRYILEEVFDLDMKFRIIYDTEEIDYE